MSLVRSEPKRNRLRRILISDSSNTPCSSPTRAKAANSSRESFSVTRRRFMKPVMASESQTSGSRTRIIGGKTAEMNPVRRRQYIAPSVLGMISETKRIRSVRTAEVTASTSDPQRRCASAPTPAAPTVWAMVLRLRIAARGRSMCNLSARTRAPTLGRSCSSLARWDGVMLRSAASRIEQRNETPSAMPT